MPNVGDYVAYFWFPLREKVSLGQGPYQPELHPEMWERGALRPNQPDLPRPTLDISLVLWDGETGRDEGLMASIDMASRSRDLLLKESRVGRARVFLRRVRRRPKRILMKTDITVVEAAVTLPSGISPASGDFQRHVTSALDSALSLTREMLVAASTESHEARLLPALELLPPVIPYFVARRVNGPVPGLEESTSGMINNAAHLAWGLEGTPTVPIAERAPLLGLPNIYSSYKALQNDAEVALVHHGQYRAAVVLAAAAAESLLNVLMESILLEEGTERKEATAILDSRDGMRVKASRVLGPRLGGEWDGREGSPVGQWIRSIVEPRHAVLHAGKHMTRTEAQEACGELHEFRRWLGGRVFLSRRRFPKTALAMSIGIMMSPAGTEKDQGGWVGKRMAEVDDEFATFLNLLPGWASSI